MQGNELTERHSEILKMVISGYIQTAQPVSSFYLAERPQMNLSSASIRHILKDLEKKGYLISPHRSSGRLPTEKGYRYYVSAASSNRLVPDDERKFIQQEYLKKEFQIKEILAVTSQILSMMTNSMGVVIGPEPEESVLKHIELIDMGEEEILFLLVTRSGTVYSKTLAIESRIPADVLQRITRYLNEAFKGSDLREVRQRLLDEKQEVGHDIYRYFPMIARTITANFDSVKGAEEIYTSGSELLLRSLSEEQKSSVNDLKIFSATDELMRGIFKRAVPMDDVVVTIDGDRDDRLSGLSIITASYKMGEKRIGSLGVIGPNRMDYQRVMSLVDYVRVLISSMITRMSS